MQNFHKVSVSTVALRRKQGFSHEVLITLQITVLHFLVTSVILLQLHLRHSQDAVILQITDNLRRWSAICVRQVTLTDIRLRLCIIDSMLRVYQS